MEFVNAQEMKKNHPDTFEAPTLIELENLKEKDFVKVACNNERFWTRILSIADNRITATVNNDLLMEELSFGETISFNKENIFMIE